MIKNIISTSIATMPKRIMSLHTSGKLRKIRGEKITLKSPIVIIAIVYIVTFRIREAVATEVEMPSLIIKKAEAGCPPLAEGVIEEK